MMIIDSDYYIQIPGCYTLRMNINYRLEFPHGKSCLPTSTPPSGIRLMVETGSTALDVMITAADLNRSYNFETSYFGDIGFAIDAVNGTASTSKCFWFFYYQFPGQSKPVKSQLGVSNVVVPGDGSTIILRYQR